MLFISISLKMFTKGKDLRAIIKRENSLIISKVRK